MEIHPVKNVGPAKNVSVEQGYSMIVLIGDVNPFKPTFWIVSIILNKSIYDKTPLGMVYPWVHQKILSFSHISRLISHQFRPHLSMIRPGFLISLFCLAHVAAWWFGCHQFGIFPFRLGGNVIIPIDFHIFHIFQRGGVYNHQPGRHFLARPSQR